MSDLSKQPTGGGGGCRKANGPSFDKIPTKRWGRIKKRIVKELIFGVGKQPTEGGSVKLPADRRQIKKQIAKDFFSTTI